MTPLFAKYRSLPPINRAQAFQICAISPPTRARLRFRHVLLALVIGLVAGALT